MAVFVSSLGAHNEKYHGLILVHADVEQSLDDVPGLNVVHLRTPTFFENLFYFLPAMREREALCSPIDPGAPIEAAATRDIAAVALRLLLACEFRGKGAVEVHGPPGLTMGKIAQLIGKQLGRSFPAERVSRDADIEALVAVGASRDFATLMNDTWDVFHRYGLLRAVEPSASSLAPTRIEDFIRDQLAPAITAHGGTAGLARSR